MGVFYNRGDRALEQRNNCFEWTWHEELETWVPDEVCREEMSVEIDQRANLGGWNNPFFCWYDYGCRLPGGGQCRGCEGICQTAFLELPSWFPGANPGWIYFLAHYASTLETIMKEHNQWVDQQADWQDSNNSMSGLPCWFENSVPQQPVMGQYGKIGQTPGWGSVPEPHWNTHANFLANNPGVITNDSMWRDLAAGLIEVQWRSAGDPGGHPLAIHQRLALSLVGYMFLNGDFDNAAKAGPDEPLSRSAAPSTNLSIDLWQAMAYATAWVLYSEYSDGSAGASSMGMPGGGYTSDFIRFWDLLQDQTCASVGDCGVVSVEASSWGSIKKSLGADQ